MHMGYQMITWLITSRDPNVLWGSTVGYHSDVHTPKTVQLCRKVAILLFLVFSRTVTGWNAQWHNQLGSGNLSCFFFKMFSAIENLSFVVWIWPKFRLTTAKFSTSSTDPLPPYRHVVLSVDGPSRAGTGSWGVTKWPGQRVTHVCDPCLIAVSVTFQYCNNQVQSHEHTHEPCANSYDNRRQN